MRKSAIALVFGLIFFIIGCGNPSSPIAGEAPDPWYRMRTETDCGPAALAFVAQIPYSTVTSAWKWPNYGDSRDNLWDTPLSHFSTMKKLGIKYRMVDGDEIAAGKAAPLRTVVLIHGFSRPFTEQHWAVLGDIGTGVVRLFMGDSETPRPYTVDQFLALYWKGTPQCAYEVQR